LLVELEEAPAGDAFDEGVGEEEAVIRSRIVQNRAESISVSLYERK
jgi:hypothetical protein